MLNKNFLTKIMSINQLTRKQHSRSHVDTDTLYTHSHTIGECCLLLHNIPVCTLACVLCAGSVIANFAHVSSTSFAKLKVKTCPKFLPGIPISTLPLFHFLLYVSWLGKDSSASRDESCSLMRWRLFHAK